MILMCLMTRSPFRAFVSFPFARLIYTRCLHMLKASGPIIIVGIWICQRNRSMPVAPSRKKTDETQSRKKRQSTNCVSVYWVCVGDYFERCYPSCKTGEFRAKMSHGQIFKTFSFHSTNCFDVFSYNSLNNLFECNASINERINFWLLIAVRWYSSWSSK